MCRHHRICQENHQPDPRSAATKDRELLSAVEDVAEVGMELR
jgi:hypothetical protein